MIASVIAVAMIPITDMETRMFLKLAALKKKGEAKEK